MENPDVYGPDLETLKGFISLCHVTMVRAGDWVLAYKSSYEYLCFPV
jgi:hypothetical protein